MGTVMSDEYSAEWRNGIPPDKAVLPAGERRARHKFGGSRALNLSAGVRKQRDARELAGIDNKALYTFPVPPARLLQECFKLTPAESRLAQFMARAELVEDAARALGVKLCTARSQLAAIFEKTGTARQAELVALLSRLAHLSQSFASRAAS
jgi:DNA-binding CsgD family transcriptional regulator